MFCFKMNGLHWSIKNFFYKNRNRKNAIDITSLIF